MLKVPVYPDKCSGSGNTNCESWERIVLLLAYAAQQ